MGFVIVFRPRQVGLAQCGLVEISFLAHVAWTSAKNRCAWLFVNFKEHFACLLGKCQKQMVAAHISSLTNGRSQQMELKPGSMPVLLMVEVQKQLRLHPW